MRIKTLMGTIINVDRIKRSIIKAEGEAKANKAKSDSITDNLIRMKEAEAREKHGWVTVNGAGSVITNKE